ncbi:MAG: helix-turn-helix domain-containing protein [Solirubrobacterales bacterium]|nr:helix-turn-helix domain-containing protein [Solirubrobacterales bacterium]
MAPDWDFPPVPAETVETVRDSLPEIVSGIVSAISAESPQYGQVLGGPEGVAIRLGIEQALRSFLEAVQEGKRPAAETGELWRRLGEAEFQAGRELDPLRAAFRTGTRAAWRNAATVAAAAGLSTELVVTLAEAIFVYTDELATQVVEGYLRAQSDQAGELERRRRRVATLLLDPAGVDSDALARAAALAHWSVPKELGVLALVGQSPLAITRHLGPEALVGSDAEGVFLVLPDPDGPGQRAQIERATREELCALGPTVGVRDASRSLRWARRLLTLVERGAVGREALARVTDHLPELLLLRDRELAQALIDSRLSVLEDLGEPERERMEETLSAWLAHQRHTPTVAEVLNVHPQTVRYRISKLRELLGDALEDSEARFELELALWARRRIGEPDPTV